MEADVGTAFLEELLEVLRLDFLVLCVSFMENA